MDKVDPQSLDISLEMGEGINQSLLGPPVEGGTPVLHQFLDVIQVAPVIPSGAGNLVRPPCTVQPFP